MLSRSEHLEFCKTCHHRKMDMNQGIICELTNAKANFTESCSNYDQDKVATAEELMRSEKVDVEDSVSVNLSDAAIQVLQSEQNFSRGIMAGLLAGVLGAFLWAGVTLITQYQIGFMAVGVGLLVGYVIRKAGRGFEPKFAFAGSIIAGISCFLGNILSILGFVSQQVELTYFETLLRFDYSFLPQLLKESFDVMDLLFYGIAIFEGYRFSQRKLTQADIEKYEKKSSQFN